MRYSGWARVTFIGDTVAAQQLVPLARAVLGELLNRADIQRESSRSVRRLAWQAIGQKAPANFGRPACVTRKMYADGSLIEAGWDGTTPWMRITTATGESAIVLNGFGFILSPFNGSLPTDGSPDYKSTLLLINDGAYANDYPDEDHHWFSVDKNGDYFDLGNEFINNGLLQGNLHWRSTADKTFHLSWLGNPSDPIAYLNITFQNGYDSGSSPYAVRLSSTTVSPSQTGSIFNFDTTQVFSAWLADQFGGLHNLQNGSGVGQVICYKGHVVKPVYDLLKPASPVTVRNCIIGVGGSVDSDTKKRTLYFVVRAFEQALPTYVLTETVYSLDIDKATAVPVQIGTRSISMTGTYNSPITVDPIPLHGYYWDETNSQFVCIAVSVRTTVGNVTSTQPTLQVQSPFANTGKGMWTITSGIANFSIDTSFDIVRGLTTQPTFKSTGTFTHVTIFEGVEEFDTIPDSVFDQSFAYGLSGAVIAVTDKNTITTNVTAKTTQHIEDHDSGGFGGDSGYQFQTGASNYTTSYSQTIAIGAKTFDVAELTLTSVLSTSTSYDVTFSHVSSSLDEKETLTYTGKSFLWFNDTDNVYAYLEFQLQWTRTVVNNYGPIPIADDSPAPTETFTLTSYQGRYVVDNTIAPQTGDWFDLTAGGQIGNAPGHSNLFAFMPKLPVRLLPDAGNDGSYTIISDTPDSQIFEKDYGPNLPLFELVNIISCSYYNIPKWQPSSSYFTGVGGRVTTYMEPDGTYSFSATHAGGWAVNGKTLCFSQIGPTVLDTLGNIASQSPFQFLTTGDLDALTGATTDARGNYPLCAIVSREILAQGQT